jgi:hypothetical protein
MLQDLNSSTAVCGVAESVASIRCGECGHEVTLAAATDVGSWTSDKPEPE